MKKALILCLVATGLVLGGSLTAASAAKKEIKIATDIPYKPMEYAQPDGSFTGFDIDLGNAMCKEAGLKCTWLDQNWNGIIPALLAHKYDAIMSSMTINARRKKHVLFSDPYIVVASTFVVPVDSPIHEINDKTLKGKKIGVQRGTVQDDYVSAEYGKIADIRRYQSADDVAVDMDVGRLDAAFFDAITSQSSLIEAYPGKFHQVGPDLTKPKKYFGSGFGMAFRKNETDLADKFNQALKAVKADGTYAKIYKRYFHKNPPSDDDNS